MKYPFSPEYLDAIPNNVVRIYRSLEEKIIEEICSRIAIRGQFNEVVLNNIRVLRERGISQPHIDKMIREYTRLGKEELDKIYEDAVKRNQEYYTDLITKADITKPNIEFSFEREFQSVEAIRMQAQTEFENLTRTTAFQMRVGGKPQLIKPRDAFYRILDDAEIQIKSGAISYNQAIKEAVKQLADSGVRTIDYASGHSDQLDVVARRAVMTGVSQICDKYTEMAAKILETNYFQVSAHIGARDKGTGWQNHKSWQGRVYSTRAGDIYPNIYEVCGLGYVDGLEGANCRHRRYCWVEGVSERTYTDEQLAHIDDGHDCVFEGKHYTAYEATQKQREIERTVRKLKREKGAFKAAMLDDEARAVSIHIRRLNKEYRSFSAAAELPMQRERMKGFTYEGEVQRI